MSVVDAVMSNPRIYQLWQAPFGDRKLQPVLASATAAGPRRVLDSRLRSGYEREVFS